MPRRPSPAAAPIENSDEILMLPSDPNMGVLVQIRDVPEEAHRVLKARAALKGRTLSDYLRAELVALAERPSPEELWERLEQRPVIPGSVATQVRAERDAREK
jgi:antitoxin FitA